MDNQVKRCNKNQRG